jgi:hypothetical protein
VLSACAPVAPELSRPVTQFLPDEGGLAVAGAGQRIDFGRSPEGVIAALDRELGRGRLLGFEGCPAGVVRREAWGDLVLTFTDERFVGWKTAAGSAGQTCS